MYYYDTALLYTSGNELDAVKQKLEEVLIDNQVDFKEAFDLCLDSISHELLLVGIITQDIHESPTYDGIIRSFISGISYIDNRSDLEKECDKFLSTLSKIGGSVACVADLLREKLKEFLDDK